MRRRPVSHPLGAMMLVIGADPTDKRACRWLASAIEPSFPNMKAGRKNAVASMVAAKSKMRPQAVRNRELQAVVSRVAALRRAFLALDSATAAAVDLVAPERGRKFHKLVLGTLRDLENAATAAKEPAKRRPDEGADEAVKLFVGFAVRYGKRKPSAKVDSPFHRFARMAFKHATGEDRDLTRSVQRVLASGYAARSTLAATKVHRNHLPAA